MSRSTHHRLYDAARRFKWILYGIVSKYRHRAIARWWPAAFLPPPIRAEFANNIRDGEIQVTDLVDIAIPANAQAAAETLGLKVHRSVTRGAQVRQIPRDEAEIAVECLRDWGFTARILDGAPRK